MLQKDELHFFNDIAYYHVPFTHCPTGEQYRLDHKCHCNPKDNFDWNGYSCEFTIQLGIDQSLIKYSLGTARYYETNGMTKPEGYEKDQ
jgi:alpha 1,2-mannosyltransferase